MRKILCIVSAFVLSIFSCLCFVGCKQKSDTLRINEVTHSVFYAPLYVAINNGYLKDAGITVELTNGGGSNNSMTALLSGQADIALMGPETVVYVASQGSTNYPKVFGQLTKRDGSFLISKTQVSGTFDWATELANKTVIAGRKGGLPAMTFEWICNNNGLYNSTNITLDTDTSFNMMVPVFESTSAEFCTMFEPTASEFVAAGKGYMVGSVGQKSGEIPYTCFMANPSFISKNSKKIESFLAAIKKAYDYIISNDSATVAQSLQPSFSSTSLESLAQAVDSYKAIDAWCSSPVMTDDSYSRLIAVMQNAGEIDKDVPFSSVVDNTYASKI